MGLRGFPRGYVPKRGDKFGSLTATGNSKLRKNKWNNRYFSEVRCPHGNTRFVRTSHLKSGCSSCRKWQTCFLIKAGQKLGSLIATGKFRIQQFRTCASRYYEVRCPHGNTKFIQSSTLKSRSSISCRSWEECGLTEFQSRHRDYMRNRMPAVDLANLSEQQNGVCVICGNVRFQSSLNSKEHLIPVVLFARSKWSLKEKNARANSPTNIFASHFWCNNSRNGLSLRSYWKKHPQFEASARAAIARARQVRRSLIHEEFLKAA
jgi:hypothetical protein